MNTTERHKDDWKLLLAIGGFVVVGAAGIAMLAGIGASREAGEAESSPGFSVVSAERETTATPLPGAVQTAGADAGPSGSHEGNPKIPGSMIGEEVSARLEPDPEESFAIDPDANLAAVGHAAFSAREFDKAAAYWSADVERRPDRAYSRYMLGLSFWKGGRLDDAERALRQAAELNPDSVRTLINLSRVLNEKGQAEAALEAAEQARLIDTEDPQALYLQARSLFNLERFDDSRVAVEQALAFDPEYGHAYNLLGLIGIHCNRYAEAAESLALAARFEPDLAFVQANHGRALELAGRYDEASRAFAAALAIDPNHGTATAGLMRIGQMQPQATTAEGDLQESVTAAANVAAPPDTLDSSAGVNDAPQN